MATPSDIRDFYAKNPAALREFQRRLAEKNEARSENERVKVKTVEELTDIVQATPNQVTALLAEKYRPDSFDYAVSCAAA